MTEPMSRAVFKQLGIYAAVIMAMACAAGQTDEAVTGDNMGLELRNMILSSEPKAANATDKDPSVVMMDMHVGDGIASVMSSSGGDASIYLSSGGGMIGGGQHQTVREAAIAFVGEAAKHKARMSPVANFPYPSVGNVRFYLRTRDGAFFLEAPESELAAGTHPQSVLFQAGQEVITQYRRVSGSQ